MHTAFGPIPDDARDGIAATWDAQFDRIRKTSEASEASEASKTSEISETEKGWGESMTTRIIAESKEAWLEARRELLVEEKEYTRVGKISLSDPFAGRTQLIVYQFMFDPDWDEGCRSCSFWSDHFAGVIPHLNARDVTLVAISRAPLAKLQAFAKRLDWNHTWVSSFGGDATYNFAPVTGEMAERHDISVFAKDEAGAIFHTYSCYGRGVKR